LLLGFVGSERKERRGAVCGDNHDNGRRYLWPTIIHSLELVFGWDPFPMRWPFLFPS